VRTKPRTALVIALASAIGGCASTLGNRQAIGDARPAKGPDCRIDVYEAEPTRPYVKISRVDAHVEITHFISPSLDDALPELKRQACLSGADALMDLKESSSGYLEMRSFHVTATGIAYR